MVVDYLKEIMAMAHKPNTPWTGGRAGRAGKKSIEDVLGGEVPEEERPSEVEEPEEDDTETRGRTAKKPDVWEGEDDYIFKSGDALVHDNNEVSEPKLDMSTKEKAKAIINDINNLMDVPEWYMGTLSNFKKFVATNIRLKYPELANLIKR